jgi:hypothetical protein
MEKIMWGIAVVCYYLWGSLIAAPLASKTSWEYTQLNIHMQITLNGHI